MNQSQRNHAIHRINELRHQKFTEATKVVKPQVLSYSERVDLIRKGKVSLKPQAELNKYKWASSLSEVKAVYDFSDYEWEGEQHLDPKREDVINKKAEEAIDQIMLGDAKEAMTLIKEFEAI